MKARVIISIYSAILLGLLFPWGEQVKPLIPWLLSILVFFSFIGMEFRLRFFLRKELLILISLLWGVIPFLCFWATYSFPPHLHLGLFLLSVTPPAIASVVIINMLRGDVNLGISSAVFFNLLSPFSISLLLQLYFGNQQVDLAVFPIFKSLVLIIFIPIVFIFIFQRFFKEVQKKIVDLSLKFSLYLLCLFIVLGVSTTRDYLLSLGLKDFFILWGAVFSLALCNYILGSLFFSQPLIKKTGMVTLGQKNTALMIGISSLYFGQEITVLVVLYILSHHIVNGFLLFVNK